MVRLTHRMKVLSRSHTLKQEKLESGEIVDVMVLYKSSSTSDGSGVFLDSTEMDVPSYSE